MKTFFTSLILLISSIAVNAQFMKVTGNKLYNADGNQVILKGINFPILDEGTVNLNTPSTYQTLIDEFAKTGANVIRIPWNTNGVHWRDGQVAGTLDGYVANGKLGELIDYCFSKQLYVILEIHDLTCQNDWNYFNTTLMNFWKSPNIVNLIQAHKSKIILNIANEFGNDANWGGNMTTFKTNYSAAITSLRNLGIEVPIMVDAPNCGSASSSLVAVSGDILNADSKKNVIFSTHTYWTAYANTNAAIDAKMNEMINSPQCFVLGEIANIQDANVCGDTDITNIYKRVLTDACPAKMGWLAWAYYKDCATNRQMTTTGYFANLTTFGDDIVNNATYGLKSNACSLTLETTDSKNSESVQIYPNPSNGEFSIQTGNKIIEVELFDSSMKKIPSLTNVSPNKYKIKTNPGVYILKMKTDKGIVNKKLIIN